jgi:hypothetical protein
VGVFLVTAITSVITITAAAIGAMVYYRSTATADPLAMVVAQVAAGRSGALLEKEREQLILQNAATEAFTVSSKPKVTGTPASSGGTSGGAPTVSAPLPDPGSAEATAKSLLPAYGFSTDQYGCLYDLWMAESGWRYNAENASGAYGIPQALPGSKMATAGADWQTNPTTQIKWGLGYIKGSYGTPCTAWAHEQNYGWY